MAALYTDLGLDLDKDCHGIDESLRNVKKSYTVFRSRSSSDKFVLLTVDTPRRS